MCKVINEINAEYDKKACQTKSQVTLKRRHSTHGLTGHVLKLKKLRIHPTNQASIHHYKIRNCATQRIPYTTQRIPYVGGSLVSENPLCQRISCVRGSLVLEVPLCRWFPCIRASLMSGDPFCGKSL